MATVLFQFAGSLQLEINPEECDLSAPETLRGLRRDLERDLIKVLECEYRHNQPKVDCEVTNLDVTGVDQPALEGL